MLTTELVTASFPIQVATPLRNMLAATTAKTLRQRRSSAGGTKESVMRIDGVDAEPDWTATAARTASGACSSFALFQIAA